MKRVKMFTIPYVATLCITIGAPCLALKAFAQQTTAEIDGTVTDDHGTPAVDVEVSARNQETGTHQVTYSANDGGYHLHLLTPGLYQVMARHLNFSTLIRKNIRLVVGHTVVVNFSMTPKEIQGKEIVIEAEAPLIDTKKSDLSVVVQPEQIQSLPLNSRNFLELAAIAPGAKVSTAGRGPITTGAVNSRFLTAYIDGGDFKNDNLGGVVGTSFGFTTNIVPEDAIREFQVITSMYKAEFSKASNGMINAITKVGTNEFHGSAFGLFRTTGLNSRGPFETVSNPLTGDSKPDYDRQQYGFSIGGPIVLDQTHFFLSTERNTINNFSTVYTSGRQPALDGTFKNPVTENLFLGKVTHQFSAANSMEFRVADVSTDNTPGNFGNTIAYSNGFNLNFRLLSVLAADRWIIGPRMVNELRLHYQRYRKIATPNSVEPEHIYQSSGIVTGWNDVQPQDEHQDKYQLREDIEFTIPDLHGTHIMKTGITFTRERFHSAAAFSSGGVFTFRTDTNALPFRGAIGIGDPSTQAWNTAFGIYAQDDWSPLTNLTLNLGLRWDFETNMINNDEVNPFMSDTALTNHIPASYGSTGHRDIDYGQVAPRMGFAWDIFDDHTSVLHGGFGLFYDRMIWNFPSNELQNGKYAIYTVTFDTLTARPTLSRDTLLSYIRRSIGGAPAPGMVLFPSSLPTAYTRQFTVGVSRQITPSIALSLDYVNVRGSNEYTTYNVNYLVGTTGRRAATQKYGGIALVTATGKSWYDAVQLSVSRPHNGDWQMQLSYTLSWAFNTFDDPFAGYVFMSSIRRAPSAQDERHRLVLSGLVNLPFDLQLSGIVSLASPRPVNVLTGTDDNLNGVTGDDFPASGRNSVRPDPGKIRNWSKNIDLRISKYFDVPGGLRIVLIAEAFNVFNWTNYLTYVNRLNARVGGVSVFGTPNSATNSRQVQLGARVMF